MNPERHTGLRRLFHASIYSYNGMKAAFRTEEAFRQELIGSLIFIPLGLYIGDGAAEKILLAGSILLILIVEILNTAVERAIDRISFDRHELSKEAKDMGSAAVLLTLLLAGMTWCVILVW